MLSNSSSAGAGYADFYQHAMPAALKKMLFVFKLRRSGMLVAKNKTPPSSFFLVVVLA
ncbi:MAG: hypothetical protein WCL42_06680 [Chlorobiaceae bacterium]|jgi:hypothetical protein